MSDGIYPKYWNNSTSQKTKVKLLQPQLLGKSELNNFITPVNQSLWET